MMIYKNTWKSVCYNDHSDDFITPPFLGMYKGLNKIIK